VSYPNLIDDLNDLFEALLGPDTYQVATEHYRGRLRSAKKTDDSEQPVRHTPQFLRIIASSDYKQKGHLDAEIEDGVGTLRWDVVRACVGPMVDLAKQHVQSLFHADE
jgi:hypothetical protein